MSSIEQLETLRNGELYDDCKILVIKLNYLYNVVVVICFILG
jgi:hypothetical protein